MENDKDSSVHVEGTMQSQEKPKILLLATFPLDLLSCLIGKQF